MGATQKLVLGANGLPTQVQADIGAAFRGLGLPEIIALLLKVRRGARFLWAGWGSERSTDGPQIYVR